ncbi:MAG TPA: hypothetical protein VE986_05660 [Hyphomicrobiales bacterium]|nr:hypothetical protein [Hyphomicrobiales bacterium]
MAFSAVVFGAMHLGKGLFRLGVRTLKARGQSVAASEEASIQLN